MSINASPRPYEKWRSTPIDRAEDAAYAFGYHLIVHRRDAAMASLPTNTSPETKSAVEEAVDTALHNVTDMLEGFWKLQAGPGHTFELALSVRVHDGERNVVESIEISPARIDLPIGDWKWTRDREFR